MLKTKKLIAATVGTLVTVGALLGFLTQGPAQPSSTNVQVSAPSSGAVLAAPPEATSTPTDTLYPDDLSQQYYSDQQDGYYFHDREGEHHEREHEDREGEHHEREHEEDDD